MIPNAQKQVHHIGGVDEEIRMSIDQDSVAHLMAILTDLYSDPILAVIREYSTNALDAHIEAGNSDPIKVSLPSTFKQDFTVTDCGVGLSVTDLRDIYSMYGRSTKRGTNEATGMLGLGCKSGLTYALSFTVTAVKEGVRTVAQVTKDAEGVGTVRILDTATTDEPNGVSITIPVKSHDINNFVTKAKDFYRWWKPGTVLVDGKEPEPLDSRLVWLDDDVAVVPSNIYGGHRVIMGGVAYPMDFNNYRPSHLNALNVTVYAWVPMGSVNFTPSREALHYTAKTKATLTDLYGYVHKMVPVAVEREMNKAKNNYEKLVIATTWRNGWAARAHVDKFGQYLRFPTDRVAWEVGLSWRSRSRKIESMALSQFVIDPNRYGGSLTIVTDFPYKSVSAVHKERLAACAIGSAIMIPDGTDLTAVEGRSHMISWDEIMQKTTSIKGTTVRVREKTRYSFYHKSTSHVEEEIPDDGTTVVWYHRESHSTDIRYANMFPEVYSVGLLERQVAKFTRLYPESEHIGDYRDRKLKVAMSRLSEMDKLSYNLNKSLWKPIADRSSDILDPDLRKIIKAFQHKQTPEMLEVIRLHGDPSMHPLHKLLEEKYLLYFKLAGYYLRGDILDDIILYLNAKYMLDKEGKE